MTVGRSASKVKADYIVANAFHREDMVAVHAKRARYWLYDNTVTVDCSRPAYARYAYGYSVWERDVDGMTSWTFQNTQNAGGPPGKAASGYTPFLAYPAPGGPTSTIKWEAIRDGIDDYKLVYQLEKRIALLKRKGKDVASYDRFLARLKETPMSVSCAEDGTEEPTSMHFDQRRHNLIAMILQADREME